MSIVRDRARDAVKIEEVNDRMIEMLGGGDLPAKGSLLDLRAGEARLSNLRRLDGGVEVRLWNPSSAEVRAEVGGQDVRLGPARIETVRLP